MATDTTAKALNLATKIMNESTLLMESVRRLAALADEKTGSGIDFAGMDFSGTALQHCTGDDIDNCITSGLATQAWLATNFHDDVFDKVHP